MEIQKLRKLVHRNNAFTLIELLVFITIISLILITAAAMAITSIFNLKSDQQKTLASYYNQTVISWLEKQKELDWNTFNSKAGTSAITYCFNQEPISGWPTSGNCANNSFLIDNTKGTIFKREVQLTKVGTDNQTVRAYIKVFWQGPNGQQKFVNTYREFSILP